MKPIESKCLKLALVFTGLFFTINCGFDKPSVSEMTQGSGNTGGVTITNEVSSPAEMGVGDIMMLKFSSGSPANFDFSGVEDSSKYYLAIGSLNYGYGSRTLTMSDSLSFLGSKGLAEASFEESVEWESWTLNDAFQQRLRDIELALSLDPDIQMADKKGMELGFKEVVVDADVSVGDTEEFRVLNSLTSLRSYATVTGRARCVEENVIIYVDTEVESTNPDDLTDADISRLCGDFNKQVVLMRRWFGEESDVNGDGKVAALLTPQVNRLGTMGGGIITGFFLASDLYARSSSNAISNEREIIYALVPNSRGHYGSITLSKEFTIENLLTAVLPHEFQHVISYNRHVFEGEGTPEHNWLNEGLSHLTEDLVGYGQENYSRSNIYLKSPPSYQVAGSGSPGLGERGAAYLFMRFLYEQHPDPEMFLWRLYHSNAAGVANVEVAFDGTAENFDQFGEFFMRWMAAVAMTNRGLSADPRYVYKPRTYNSDTNRWQGICLICNAEDGRGTQMGGPAMTVYDGGTALTMYSSAARFYDIENVPDEINFSTLSDGTFGAVLIRRE